ncbi:proton myo-inositol cotransporter-like isoform X2 [Nerophis lumbriciformis]|uniref:proton myo-inositol cotransporter-like isoform X2 n=1 Tax=Nerophis lumbriciformis TaxID=546530 RepID=UPI002ADF68F3|nr:proton myo-inositol cotransporter-like isoform X2 [Nerophis lumbriciformis]
MFSRQDKPSLKHPRSVIIMSITKNRKGGEDDGERRLIGSPSRNAAAPVGTFVYVLAFFSGLGGFLFGYDTGVVSGALLLLKREMNLNTLWQELVVSSTVGAAAVSSLSGGYLNGLLGRRKCTLVASFIFTIGGFIMTFAPNKEVLLVGRIIIGLGIGVGSMTLPVYIAEVSPPHMRGQLVTVITVLITAGQFSANVVDGAFSYMKRDGWRYMLGLSVVPAIGQFVGFLFLPESPRWLLQKGRHQEARRVLSRIRGCQDVDEEYDYIQSSIEEEEKGAKDGEVIFFRILRHGPTRRALIVGCGLQMFQQLTGINTVMYYSATILQMSGVRDERQAIWLSAVTSGTNFVCTSLSIWLVDRVGRRKLTLASITGTTLSLSVLSIGFLLSAQNSPAVTLRPLDSHNSSCTSYRTCSDCMLNPACGFCYRQNSSDIFDSTCLPANPTSSDHSAWGRCFNQTDAPESPIWAYNYCPTLYSWVVLAGLLLYLMSFAPGMGPMPWTINSEIYPLWARSTGNACSAGINWIFNVILSLTFLHVAELLTYQGIFFLYTGFTVLGFLFILCCLPETKGLQLEDIENLFMGPLCSCGDGLNFKNQNIQYTRKHPDLIPADYGSTGSDMGIAYITVSTAYSSNCQRTSAKVPFLKLFIVNAKWVFF